MTQTTWKGSTLRYADTPGRAGMIVTWKGCDPATIPASHEAACAEALRLVLGVAS